jgi:hypothetical protein
MSLQKVVLRPGVNRENTRYTNEGGWYESNLVRFRQGTPEKIGGWARISANYFLGVCRSLWNWVTLGFQNLLGVGTNLKFYIENQGTYYDITPIVAARTLTNPFTTDGLTAEVTVTDGLGGYAVGSFVTFSGTDAALTVGGLIIRGEYQITSAVAGSYTVATPTIATAGTSTGTVYADYQLSASPSAVVPLFGWGAGTWGSGVWGTSGSAAATPTSLAIWNQNNFGQNLIYGPRGGALYYWDATIGYAPTTATFTNGTPGVVSSTLTLADLTPITFQTTGELPTGVTPGTIYYARAILLSPTTFNLSATPTGALIALSGTPSGTNSISPRGVAISALAGANETPLAQNYFLISDASRFVICFGANDYLGTVFDPMLIRWSDQESVTEWAPAVTNQAGSIRLSHGSKIVTALQSRQEILVWTDSTLYSMQYLGPPYVWSTQLLGDNVSIAGPNAAALASGGTYWMGVDKFYKYDGRVQTLNCDLLRFVYNDINRDQFDQVFASTNEGFNEVWFFYCTAGSNEIDRYVAYNYLENCWYYGSMSRPSWLDTGLRNYPLAATYDKDSGTGNIVQHELGVDDNTTGTPVAMDSFITSAQFDIGDGHNFAFVWRMLPDLTFAGSTAGTTPSMTIQLLPLQNSGSGYNNPISIGGTSATGTQTVTATQTYPIDLDTYNGQLNIRVRGRQMSMRIACNTPGTQWQMGSPRIDTRPDGRRGG